MKPGPLILLGVVAAIVIGGGAFFATRGSSTSGSVPDAPASERPPAGTRVRVQVLNGTRTRGLARRATMLLRDRGFDVLEVGTLDDARDTTLVLDLSGHPDWANRVARALAPARVEARADSSRYLDVAVILGATWRPPAKPFYP